MPTESEQPVPTIYTTFTGREMALAKLGEPHGYTDTVDRFYNELEKQRSVISHVYFFQPGFQAPHKHPETHHPEMVERYMERWYPGAIRVAYQNFTDEVRTFQTGGLCQPAKKPVKKPAKKTKAA